MKHSLVLCAVQHRAAQLRKHCWPRNNRSKQVCHLGCLCVLAPGWKIHYCCATQNLKLAEGGKTNNVQRVGNAVSGKLASLFSARKEGKGGGGGAERGINSVNVGDENGDGKSDGSSASY